MGYLTTITYSDFLKNQDETLIKDSMNMGIPKNFHRSDYPRTSGIGSSANPVIIQKPRHADDISLYMHFGNTVKCLDEVNENDKWIIEPAIAKLEYRLKQLKKLRK